MTPYGCDASSSKSPPVQIAKLPACSDNISPCMLVQFTSRSAVPVTLKSNLCLPGRAEVLANCVLLKSSQEQLGMVTHVVDISSLPGSILAAYTVYQAKGKLIPVRLMNTSNTDIELQKGQNVSKFCALIEGFTPSQPPRPTDAEVYLSCSTSGSPQLVHQLTSAC